MAQYIILIEIVENPGPEPLLIGAQLGDGGIRR